MTVYTTKIQTDQNGNRVHPAWLVGVTPGAADAKAALEAITATLPGLRAAAQTASNAAAPLGQWQPTATPGQPVWAKKPDVSTADFEAAEAVKREAGRALTAALNSEKAARKKLDDLIWHDGPVAGERRAAAAKYALAMQDEAAAAWAALTTALQAREEAIQTAGRPGKNWVNARGIATSNDLAVAQRTLGIIVSTFDTDAIQAVAAGEAVAPEKRGRDQAIRPVRRDSRLATGDARIVGLW